MFPKRPGSSVSGGNEAKRKHINFATKGVSAEENYSGTSVRALCAEYGGGRSAVYGVQKERK